MIFDLVGKTICQNCNWYIAEPLFWAMELAIACTVIGWFLREKHD